MLHTFQLFYNALDTSSKKKKGVATIRYKMCTSLTKDPDDEIGKVLLVSHDEHYGVPQFFFC